MTKTKINDGIKMGAELRKGGSINLNNKMRNEMEKESGGVTKLRIKFTFKLLQSVTMCARQRVCLCVQCTDNVIYSNDIGGTVS